MRKIKIGDRVLVTKNGVVDNPGIVTKIVYHDEVSSPNLLSKTIYFYQIIFDSGNHLKSGCNVFTNNMDESIKLDISRIREELIDSLL